MAVEVVQERESGVSTSTHRYPAAAPLSGGFSFSSLNVGVGNAFLVVTDADGAVAGRTFTIIVCRDPNDPTSCLL